ncbi:phosphoribosylglycinamide formyltransferase [Lysobacter sp. GX 14042]|uniref:phosphoribosylglycinamide formyltransferase n=1 Tax=Lysobacter sp. GX 14042 TaxID=2907155 RepID=UPI001F229F31|nr:phosphoribosylglycinamide formyltransferase [Lysobacter sp. GX 14042]MCE7031850.1 phosphoribosylglycinamide formyltransferase [Lysobacter sp. GX 14042]
MAGDYRIAVLASGRGSNLQAIIDAIAAGRLDARVAGVFSDRPAAPALRRAREAGIPGSAVSPKDWPDRDSWETALFERIAAVAPDLVVCAGYMRLIGPAAVAAWAGRMINIHPSLLPAFTGLHTHRQALEAGVAEHGCSLHFVTTELDGGPVISQARVPVLPGDDEAGLAARVLGREHPLMLATLRLLAAGRIRLSSSAVMFDGEPLPAPLRLDSADLLHRPDLQPD